MALCTFATCCYEKDWKLLLLDPKYLEEKQIQNHSYPFSEKLLVINNVENLDLVKKAADKLISKKILTRYVVAKDLEKEMLSFFKLKKEDFRSSSQNSSDWVYFNALGPLTAIYTAQNPYLLYQTGDVFLKRAVSWIDRSLRFMEKNKDVKVANLTWNENFKEAKEESYRKTWNFFVAKKGFSDQMFLIKTDDFRAPIYSEIHEESGHFPWGDLFEKRVFSWLLNRGFKRITYRRGSYIHENVGS